MLLEGRSKVAASNSGLTSQSSIVGIIVACIEYPNLGGVATATAAPYVVPIPATIASILFDLAAIGALDTHLNRGIGPDSHLCKVTSWSTTTVVTKLQAAHVLFIVVLDRAGHR